MHAIEAIRAGDLEALRAVLSADPSLASQTSDEGVPAVLLALYHRRQDMVELLLEAGAEVDFFTACALGRESLVAQRLDADPRLLSAHSPDGWTGLHLAAFFGRTGAVRLLLERGADPTALSTNASANLPLHAAAAGRSVELVRILLDAGTPPDAAQHGGFTALHSAAQNRDQAMIDLLLARGADLHAAAGDGRTPAGMLES